MVGIKRPPGYQPTPLEALARDHNWRQGSLRRLWANLEILRDPLDKITALQLVQNEIDRTKLEYEQAKQEILNDNNRRNNRG